MDTPGHGCGTKIQRDDYLRRTPGQYPAGLQPGAAGNRPGGQSIIDKWKTYPTDVFLGAHTWFFNLTGKYKKMQANPKGPNVWIDPNGYKKYIADTQALRDKLIAEQSAAGPPPPRGGGRGGPQ